MSEVRTSATHKPQVGMLVAVLHVRYVLVRRDEDGRWWGGRAQRQAADGTWVPDTSTFLWPVPQPFRFVEDAPGMAEPCAVCATVGRVPGDHTLRVLYELRAAGHQALSVPALLGRLGWASSEAKRAHNALQTLCRRGEAVRVSRGRFRAVPRV